MAEVLKNAGEERPYNRKFTIFPLVRWLQMLDGLIDLRCNEPEPQPPRESASLPIATEHQKQVKLEVEMIFSAESRVFTTEFSNRSVGAITCAERGKNSERHEEKRSGEDHSQKAFL